MDHSYSLFLERPILIEDLYKDTVFFKVWFSEKNSFTDRMTIKYNITLDKFSIIDNNGSKKFFVFSDNTNDSITKDLLNEFIPLIDINKLRDKVKELKDKINTIDLEKVNFLSKASNFIDFEYVDDFRIVFTTYSKVVNGKRIFINNAELCGIDIHFDYDGVKFFYGEKGASNTYSELLNSLFYTNKMRLKTILNTI